MKPERAIVCILCGVVKFFEAVDFLSRVILLIKQGVLRDVNDAWHFRHVGASEFFDRFSRLFGFLFHC